jgi:hypothetical protein
MTLANESAITPSCTALQADARYCIEFSLDWNAATS